VFDAAEAKGVSLFAAPIPDVAAAIRIMRFARRKLQLDVPITTSGSCRKSNGMASTSVRPTPAQLQIRSEFKSLNEVDFPNAALSTRTWTRENAFLGPLIDEHMETRGHLKEIDVEAWRRVYIVNLVRIPEDQAEVQRSEFNDILEWMTQKGAARSEPISAEEMAMHRARGTRLPQYYQQPFRFSDALVATTVAERAPTPPPGLAGGRITAMTQDATGILVHVEAADAEFTIHDYMRVVTALMTSAIENPARMILEDPAVFRSRVVLGVLDLLAAFSQGAAVAAPAAGLLSTAQAQQPSQSLTTGR
jgi:hypothetical protein